jgi:dTDP-4-amino-4,6-dideoxygalactose transaminase
MHYPLPIHLHAAFASRFGFKRGTAPSAERFCERVLSLPVAPHVSEDDIHRVAGHIRTFFGAAVVRAQ